MDNIRPDCKTRTLGLDQQYTPLHIVDMPINVQGLGVVNVMGSVWKPTPEELEILNNDGFVFVKIVGTNHPPIIVEVLRNE